MNRHQRCRRARRAPHSADPKGRSLRPARRDGLHRTAVRLAKILGAARLGQTLEFAATVVGRLEVLIQADATVRVAGRTILEVTLTLAGAAA